MNKEIRPGKRRVSLNIPTELHNDVRALAFHRGVAITHILVIALVEYINREKETLKPYRDMR